ncbi:MAG: UTP--glucose-1-phosphate uridylyltransferase, partial [Myxococcales bacterium]|nr:UTP--glucose-1-phosphate uridylyltransferase [Myxococcales bacterium]
LNMVEKPTPQHAPSNLIVSGRYVLPPRVFAYLSKTQPGHAGEIQLTDALVKVAREEGLLGLKLEGVRHDIGDKLGYLKASIALAMQRQDLGDELRRYMREVLGDA